MGSAHQTQLSAGTTTQLTILWEASWRRKIMRTWLFILVCLFEIAATPSADSAQYVVEGLALGDRVRFDSSIYQSYTCQPSDEFADLTNCRRTQRRDTSSILSSTIIHTQDGTAIYLMANVAPVSLSRNVVEREIEELSRQIKNRPTRVDWDQSSVIALWGDLKLDNPSSKELEGIEAGGLSPRMGLLVDRFGDTKRSAGDLVYRITGGPGYL